MENNLKIDKDNELDRLRLFYEALNSEVIFARTDLEGIITEAIDNFCKLSGYSREELIGQNQRIVNSGKHSK